MKNFKIISISSLILMLISCQSEELDINEQENVLAESVQLSDQEEGEDLDILEAVNTNERATNENHLDLTITFYDADNWRGKGNTIRINGNFERDQLKKTFTKNIAATSNYNRAKSWRVTNNSHRHSDISYTIYAYGKTNGKGRRARIGEESVGAFAGTRVGEKNVESISYSLAISN